MFKAGEEMIGFFSNNWLRSIREKNESVLQTYDLLISTVVRMLYHWATGDSWELRPEKLGWWNKHPVYWWINEPSLEA